jgi:hypothetical protein
MENIRNLGLSIQRADDHEHQEALNVIAEQLGIEGEHTLFAAAKRKGVYFFPKYLNENVDESTDDAAKDTRRGGTVGDPGVHFPAPRQRGDTGPPPTEDAFWADRQGAGAVVSPGAVRG